jgi:hypothetical protein
MKTFKLLLLASILPLVSLGQDYELRSVIVKNDNQTGGDYHVTVQVRAVSNGFVSASFSQAVVFDATALSIETVGQSGVVLPSQYVLHNFFEDGIMNHVVKGQNETSEIAFGAGGFIVKPNERVGKEWKDVITLKFTIISPSTTNKITAVGPGRNARAQQWNGFEGNVQVPKVFYSGNQEQELLSTNWNIDGYFNQEGNLIASLLGETTPERVELTLIDMNGNIIVTQKFEGVERNEMNIELDLATGIYILNVTDLRTEDSRNMKLINK